MTPKPSPGPRARTCALLSAGVLLAHLALLSPLNAANAVAAPEAASGPSPVLAPAAPQPALPLPLQVTGVRWEPAAAPAPVRAPALRTASATPPAAAASVQLAQAKPAPAASAAAPAAAPASDPPPSAELRYEVSGTAKGFNYNATGSLSWRREGPTYEARMELAMPLLGKRVQTSRGSIGPDGLRPQRFADLRKDERAAHFEAAARRIRFSNNAPDAEWLPGAQDRLSLFLQLGGLLRAQPRQTGDVLSFQVAGVGDAEVWQFEVGALETLDLPAGQVQARALRRAARKPQDSTVEVWLAPSVQQLPVRLRITQPNGDVADQRLSKLP